MNSFPSISGLTRGHSNAVPYKWMGNMNPQIDDQQGIEGAPLFVSDSVLGLAGPHLFFLHKYGDGTTVIG